MSITKNLVERFQETYAYKFNEVIGLPEAESQLRELASIVRLTSAKEEVKQNG